MIDYKDRGVLQIIFSWTGSALARCWKSCLINVIIAIICTVLKETDNFDFAKDMDVAGWMYCAVPIAFLLVFRNGMAYNRYFEGRNHVGFMVWNVRQLFCHARQYIVGQDAESNNIRRNIGRLAIAYTRLNRINLRGEEPDQDYSEVEPLLTNREIESLKASKKNHPVTVLMWLGDVCIAAKHKYTHDLVWESLDTNIGGMLQAFMGMQKLATTPMPFPYVQMILCFVYLWLFTLPFPLTTKFGAVAIPVAFLLGFAFFGLNAIGEELEDPFGTDMNDLPLEFFEGACLSAAKLMLPGIPLELDAAEKEGSVELALPAASPTSPTSPGISASPAATITKSVQQNPLNNAVGWMAATEFDQLSGEYQTIFQDHFTRFDQSGNGLIDTDKELLQLVTNLSFKLKLGDHLTKLLEHSEKAGKTLGWNLPTFSRWFLSKVKLC